MTIYAAHAARWCDEDVQMLKDNEPSPASYGFLVPNMEIDVNKIGVHEWEDVRNAFNTLAQYTYGEAESTFTIALPAIHESGNIHGNMNPKASSRIRRLKRVINLMEPVPACPEFMVVLLFEKFPTYHEFITEVRKVERAAYGKPQTSLPEESDTHYQCGHPECVGKAVQKGWPYYSHSYDSGIGRAHYAWKRK